MSERAQKDVDIQNRVLLKTLTFQTKTTSKYCSKSSSTGAKLKAERWSAVPHHKVITNGLFTPHTCGTGLPPALAAQGTLPLSRALLPSEVVLCFPSFCAGALMLQAAHQHVPSTAAPFHWWWQCLDIPKSSFLWPPRCWNQFPSYSFVFNAGGGGVLCRSPRRSHTWEFPLPHVPRAMGTPVPGADTAVSSPLKHFGPA